MILSSADLHPFSSALPTQGQITWSQNTTGYSQKWDKDYFFFRTASTRFGNNVLEITQCGVMLTAMHGVTGILFAEVAELWTTPGRRTIITMRREEAVTAAPRFDARY